MIIHKKHLNAIALPNFDMSLCICSCLLLIRTVPLSQTMFGSLAGPVINPVVTSVENAGKLTNYLIRTPAAPVFHSSRNPSLSLVHHSCWFLLINLVQVLLLLQSHVMCLLLLGCHWQMQVKLFNLVLRAPLQYHMLFLVDNLW